MAEFVYAVLGTAIFLGTLWVAVRAYAAARITRGACSAVVGLGLALALAIPGLAAIASEPLLGIVVLALAAVPGAAVMYAVAPSLAHRA